MPPLAAAVTPTTSRPLEPAAAATAPVLDVTATADPVVAGGWVSQQGKRKRRRVPRRQAAAGSVATAGVGAARKSPAKAAAARYSAQPEGSRRRSQDTPSPVPYSGPASTTWLPILLVLLLIVGVAALLILN